MMFLKKEEREKYEAAQALGLLPKLLRVGWAGLSTAESGRVGGVLSARRRKEGSPAPRK